MQGAAPPSGAAESYMTGGNTMAYVFSGTARFRVSAAVLLFCALCLGWGGGAPAQTMLPAAPTTSSTPLLPYLDYLLDETGTCLLYTSRCV